MLRELSELRRHGVLGINRRNADYTLRWNPRYLYPRVDDKLVTKRLCQAAGIPVPRLLGVASHHFELRALVRSLQELDSFVVKPAHGAMGNGVIVIVGRRDGLFLRPSGPPLDADAIAYHAAGIISGLYALAGQTDSAMVEERLEIHPDFAEIVAVGVPDVRVVIFRGVPVMAMTRLPTRRSGGRANLHQGAIGAGIDLVSGTTVHAVLRNRPVTLNLDTERSVIGCRIPDWERVLDIAVHATDETGLGYVGADVVVDAGKGAVILELNARPGLAIQIANRAGLLPRLAAVEASLAPGASREARIALGRRIAAAQGRE
jgi:alpha-L-glutamate ligase-like protein